MLARTLHLRTIPLRLIQPWCNWNLLYLRSCTYGAESAQSHTIKILDYQYHNLYWQDVKDAHTLAWLYHGIRTTDITGRKSCAKSATAYVSLMMVVFIFLEFGLAFLGRLSFPSLFLASCSFILTSPWFCFPVLPDHSSTLAHWQEGATITIYP